jgi:hypothetical protein
VHPVEAAWRKFRNSEHRDLFERSFKLRQSFLESIGLKRCPPEVALPLGVPWNLAALTEVQKGGKPIGRLGASNAMLVNTIHVWAAYREAKTFTRLNQRWRHAWRARHGPNKHRRKPCGCRHAVRC